MDFSFACRHVDVPEELRTVVREKVSRLSRHLDGWDTAEIHFTEERNPRIADREICEITLRGSGHVARAKASAPEMLAAVDRVVDKLEHQVDKLKTRLQRRSHGRRVNGPGEATTLAEQEAPDVVLMDVRMPHLDGIEATRRIRESFPMTRIIVLTVSDEEDDLFDAVKAGANGYLLKEVSIEEVASAVRAVMAGQSLLSPAMAAKLISEFGTVGPAGEGVGRTPATRLTDHELDVLRRVARGMHNEAIAAELDVSESTVRNHVANILAKLQFRSRMEAAVQASRRTVEG
jgi:ribosomal subunit interface protein